MIEYVITRDQLKKLFDWINELSPEEWRRTERLELYTNLEVPELVRCRDCKYFTPKGAHKFENGRTNLDYCKYIRGFMLQITPDGFCAWAERRDSLE